MARRVHVFISHHFADDQGVTALTDLLTRRDCDVRNSSIRLKEANRRRLERGEVSENTLKRVLRMKISWASAAVVLIGADTHARPWVTWEIETAHRLGKRIVGVYLQGGGEADVPPALAKYASSIVGWNSEAILDAVTGVRNDFQTPDGDPRPPADRPTSNC